MRAGFCEFCLKAYDTALRHNCKRKCKCCKSLGEPCQFERWIGCDLCLRYFVSQVRWQNMKF